VRVLLTRHCVKKTARRLHFMPVGSIITASPNKDGLTAACGEAAVAGITGAGGNVEVFDISALKLEPCRICGEGVLARTVESG